MREPSGPPPAEDLLPALRQRRVEALVAEAELIRDHPPSSEREDAARRHVREAMMQHSVGQMTGEERDRILGILSFAVDSMKQDQAAAESEKPDVPLTRDEP